MSEEEIEEVWGSYAHKTFLDEINSNGDLIDDLKGFPLGLFFFTILALANYLATINYP